MTMLFACDSCAGELSITMDNAVNAHLHKLYDIAAIAYGNRA
jgi:hypothetical protein